MYHSGVDLGTNWEGLGLSDEEIARRLQIAEENPNIEHIGERNPDEKEAELARQHIAPQLSALKSQRIEQLKIEAEQAKTAAKRDAAALVEAKRKEATLRQELAEQKRPLQVIRKLYDIPLYKKDIEYSKWYGLIPARYSTTLKMRLEELIKRIIKQELYNKTEREIEARIRKLIQEEAPKPATPKKPRRRSKSPSKTPRRSPRKKSPTRSKKSPAHSKKSPTRSKKSAHSK